MSGYMIIICVLTLVFVVSTTFGFLFLKWAKRNRTFSVFFDKINKIRLYAKHQLFGYPPLPPIGSGVKNGEFVYDGKVHVIKNDQEITGGGVNLDWSDEVCHAINSHNGNPSDSEI